ncbi:piggyBac transposable element-derived protein 2-like [Palaemon carinicauda]|uniref:piggyBac transposable element-derived protein 2-like n=1 Tax=Palaemon carinicauda TaxID=392227 RepID=UPI0035B59076
MKPIRFGSKVWCLNSDDGYLVTFDLYQGRTSEGNEVNEKVFGKCAATVLKNIDSLSEEKRSLPYIIYFDNLFTSFQLLIELKDRNYGATGTIRANRCKHCPLKSVDSMKKTKERSGRVRYRQGE